jgi:hypothetical protein
MASHLSLIGAISLLIYLVVTHDKITFVKTFRDPSLNYEDQ